MCMALSHMQALYFSLFHIFRKRTNLLQIVLIHNQAIQNSYKKILTRIINYTIRRPHLETMNAPLILKFPGSLEQY